MFRASQVRLAAGMTVLGATLLLATGCWTRLTTPKEAINYRNPDGSLRENDGKTVARMILAPQYNEFLRTKSEDGRPPYYLQPGTLISLEIYGHAIERSVTIRPDGKVDLPLIGEVEAAGQTIGSFKDEISQKYAAFYVDPPQVILNTEVTENDPTVKAGEVSVIQPTGSQGVVNLTGDEFLSEALAGISALNAKSEWNEVAIIRRGQKETSERYIIVCDLEQLFRYGDLDQDVRLRNGDVVFIPAERNTLLEEILATVGVIATFTGDVNTITSYVERVEGW